MTQDQDEAATTHVDPIRAEAESIVETYNTAKPDHAPPLSWFGMTTLRDGDDVREGFVFDVDGYLDRDGWEAVRWHGRVIDSVDARDETDEEYEVLDAALSVIIPVEDDVIPEGARTDPDSISEVSADAN